MKGKELISLLVYIIGFVLVWNLLDLLYSTFITKSSYEFSLSVDMIVPLTMMILIQIVSMSRKNKQ